MLTPLRDFVRSVTDAIDRSAQEEMISPLVKTETKKLVASSNWLPDEFRRCESDRYSQHLLYCDPKERFSVVSFVWAPNQFTPIHDHTVWGVIGQLIGEEQSQSFQLSDEGSLIEVGEPHVLRAGQVATLSPHDIDIHLVRNTSDAVAVSIHVYGANIGKIKRHSYDRATGQRSVLVSWYSNEVLPNIWR